MPLRKKRNSAPPASVADRIGALPDSTLHHMLSFLPAQEAVQTCMLARRWRHLWRSTTSLRIYYHYNGNRGAQDLRKFVDHLLILRERTANLDNVKIKLGRYSSDDVPYANLWIRFAVMCKLRVLTFRAVPPDLPLDDFCLNYDSAGVFCGVNNNACKNCVRIKDDCSSDCVLLGGISSATHLVLLSESRKFIFARDLKHCPTFSKLKTLLLNEYWCEAPDLNPLACILKNSPVLEELTLQLFSKGPEHEVEMEGTYSPMEGPAAISEHLNIVEVKCSVVDKRILKVLKFLSAYNIRFSFE